MATIHFHPDHPTSLVPEAVATIKEMIAAGEGTRTARGLVFTVITLPDGWSAVWIAEEKNISLTPYALAMEALRQATTAAIENGACASALAGVFADIAYPRQSRLDLIRHLQEDADEEAAERRADRETRRAENGWRDA